MHSPSCFLTHTHTHTQCIYAYIGNLSFFATAVLPLPRGDFRIDTGSIPAALKNAQSHLTCPPLVFITGLPAFAPKDHHTPLRDASQPSDNTSLFGTLDSLAVNPRARTTCGAIRGQSSDT